MIWISVVIPTYERFEALQRCLKSVVAAATRLPPDFRAEIVVVNDGSTDARYYRGNWLRDALALDSTTTTPPISGMLVHRSLNSREERTDGRPCVAVARNAGVRVARGQYIAFVDDDDQVCPEKLATQLRAMLVRGEMASSTDAWVGSARAAGLSTRFMADLHGSLWTQALADPAPVLAWDASHFEHRNPVITSTVIVHRRVFESVGFFNETAPMGGAQGVYEDYDLWRRIARVFGWMFVREPLAVYDDTHAGRQYYRDH